VFQSFTLAEKKIAVRCTLTLNLLVGGDFCTFGFRLHEQLQEDDDAAIQYTRYVEQTEVVGVRA